MPSVRWWNSEIFTVPALSGDGTVNFSLFQHCPVMEQWIFHCSSTARWWNSEFFTVPAPPGGEAKSPDHNQQTKRLLAETLAALRSGNKVETHIQKFSYAFTASAPISHKSHKRLAILPQVCIISATMWSLTPKSGQHTFNACIINPQMGARLGAPFYGSGQRPPVDIHE
jgi:hypothetical protein